MKKLGLMMVALMALTAFAFANEHEAAQTAPTTEAAASADKAVKVSKNTDKKHHGKKEKAHN